MELLGIKCIDGGTCHHACKDKCFRRECCSPFSDYDGEWAYEDNVGKSGYYSDQEWINAGCRTEEQIKIENLESIIFDLCNGYHNWWDIQEDTAESEERCKEILEVYNHIKDKYK